MTSFHTWPSGKLLFDCQKIAKNFDFFSLQKLPFLSTKKTTKNANGNLRKKKTIFGNKKKKSTFWQFFDSQMAIFQRVSVTHKHIQKEADKDLVKKQWCPNN